MRKFCLAITFLSVLPGGARYFSGRAELAAAAAYFPLVGLLLGLIMGCSAFLMRPLMPQGPLVAIIFLLAFILTRGLHLDGLADTVDGLIGGKDAEQALQIMRDSAIGPMGVCVILFIYIFKYAVLTSLTASLFFPAVITFPFCGRWAMVLAGALFAPARAEGLGNLFIAALKWKELVFASLLSMIIICLLSFFSAFFLRPLLSGIFVAFTCTLLFAFFTAKQLGGLTGDVLGAVNELAEAGFLLGVILCI